MARKVVGPGTVCTGGIPCAGGTVCPGGVTGAGFPCGGGVPGFGFAGAAGFFSAMRYAAARPASSRIHIRGFYGGFDPSRREKKGCQLKTTGEGHYGRPTVM
jgi:hypothetical protein